MFEITRPEMMDQLLIAMGMVMKKVSVQNKYNCIYIIYLFSIIAKQELPDKFLVFEFYIFLDTFCLKQII